MSVTSISSHSFKARKLKIGKDNPHINETKSNSRFLKYFIWGMRYLRSKGQASLILYLNPQGT